jgi:hypothetical protein
MYLAIELSSSSWVIAYRVPRNDKAKLHRLEAGDGAGRLRLSSAAFGGDVHGVAHRWISDFDSSIPMIANASTAPLWRASAHRSRQCLGRRHLTLPAMGAAIRIGVGMSDEATYDDR